MTEFWPQWQGEVINGVYSLRRVLHASEHSAVFLAESTAQGAPTTAIRLMPAEQVTLAQLSHWRAAANLSHPHLIRLLDAGVCQLAGRQFLFVAMEYAEQTLSQVLLQRPLNSDEVQEMLPAVVDALAFLHSGNLVQGELKPANVLVVNDRLKLASDSIRPSGEPRASNATASSPYDPPEAEGGRLAPAGDMWALGMTVVEALTQRLPASGEQSLTAGLPTTLAPTLVDTVQRCLSRDPASRPTAIELESRFRCVPREPELGIPAGPPRDTPDRAPPLQESPKPRVLVLAFAALLVLAVAVLGGLRLLTRHPSSPPSAATTVPPGSRAAASTRAAAPQAAQTPLPPAPTVAAAAPTAKASAPNPTPPRSVSHPAAQAVPPLADDSSGVVHEELPSVPHSASETIHGHVKVTMLVFVDPAGNVTDAILQDPGPSAYFARLAKGAARKWKFAPAETQDTRKELLRFEFTRSGTTARAVAPRSQ
jgi:serine/threonine protein kinase